MSAGGCWGVRSVGRCGWQSQMLLPALPELDDAVDVTVWRSSRPAARG